MSGAWSVASVDVAEFGMNDDVDIDDVDIDDVALVRAIALSLPRP